MILNVSKIINNPGSSRELSFDEKIDFIECGKEKIKLIEPVRFVGEISCGDGKELYLTGKLNTRIELPCSRCLQPVEVTIELSLKEYFTKKGNLKADDEEFHPIEGNEIDLGPVFIKDILLNIPMKNLCNAHCKGLCPKCGQDLNKGTCNCKEDVIDERFAVLKTLFNGSNS